MDYTTLTLRAPGVGVEYFFCEYVLTDRRPAGTMASGIRKCNKETLLDLVALTLRALVLANTMLWFGKCYLYVRAFSATPAS